PRPPLTRAHTCFPYTTLFRSVRRLVGVMGDLNAGLFELAGEAVGRELSDPVAFRDYHVRLRDLAVETGRPVTWGNFSRLEAPDVWRRYLDLLDETAAAGGRMFAQVHSRGLNVVLSFKIGRAHV